MHNRILGFSQEALIRYGITLNEALILKWFLQFIESNQMLVEVDENNERFYWVSYAKLINDLPIIFCRKPLLSREEKENLRNEAKHKAKRLLKSLCKKGILKQATIKNKSHFAINQDFVSKLLMTTTRKLFLGQSLPGNVF